MDSMGDVTDPQNPTFRDTPPSCRPQVGDQEDRTCGDLSEKIDDLTGSTMLSTWMSQEVSKWLVSGL